MKHPAFRLHDLSFRSLEGGARIAMALGLLSPIYFFLAAAPDPRLAPGWMIALWCLSFAGSVLWSLPGKGTAVHRPAAMMSLSFLLHAAALIPPVTLSSDIWRYLWEGKAQALGPATPFLYPPGHPVLTGLAPGLAPHVHHQDVSAAYPAATQWIFRLAAPLDSIWIFRLLAALASLGAGLVLIRLLRDQGKPVRWAALWLLNPLVVIESAGSGHFDSMGVLFFLLAYRGVITFRRIGAGIWLAAAILTKWLPAALLPFAIRRDWKVLIPLCVTGFLLMAPYLEAGPALFAGSARYARDWRFNDFGPAAVEILADPLWDHDQWRHLVFAGGRIYWVSDQVRDLRLTTPSGDPDRDLSQAGEPTDFRLLEPGRRDFKLTLTPLLAARGLCLLGLLVIAAAAWYGRFPLSRAMLWIMGGALLASATAHPWYVLWILPWAILRRERGWILLSGTMPFSYAVYWSFANGVPWNEIPWVRWLVWAPPLLLLLADRRRHPQTPG
ncbi:MAG: hypothetical protein GMKNLPBB_00531 [Myxococcota bacterium]|nr:hypothetical protein [Myxococcota bacterium]